MMPIDWQPSETAPIGVEVMTKIDDADGIRNIQKLTRDGNLWWICRDGKRQMYVYYTPTHWSPIP